jgi:hypothetical protein
MKGKASKTGKNPENLTFLSYLISNQSGQTTRNIIVKLHKGLNIEKHND